MPEAGKSLVTVVLTVVKPLIAGAVAMLPSVAEGVTVSDSLVGKKLVSRPEFCGWALRLCRLRCSIAGYLCDDHTLQKS